jgi:hypothetical protein
MKKICLFLMAVLLAASCSQDSDAARAAGDGQGGSTAIFVLKGNYLYAVDHASLNVFSLVNPAGPVKVNQIGVGFDIETLYTDADNLYIGAQGGMYIYSIANPESPQFVGQALHVTACDPVVSNGTHAFVTLHSHTWCGNTTNALMVYDLANPQMPQLIHQRNLAAPKGLALYGHYLFVCDDSVLVFDITNPAQPTLAANINRSGHDIIIKENTLFIVGDSHIYNYTLNPSDIANITLNSELAL